MSTSEDHIRELHRLRQEWDRERILLQTELATAEAKAEQDRAIATITLERDRAIAKLELDRERAVAQARGEALETVLMAERAQHEATEQQLRQHQAASEAAYEARIAQLAAEVQLWRADDRLALFELLATRVRAIDSSLLDLRNSMEPLSPAMQAAVATAEAERVQLLATQDRLRGI